MSLPLLSAPPVSQNARVTSFAVGSDETPRQVPQSIGRNAARVDDLIEQAYRQIFFHAFKVDRDAALESQLRSDQITVRDFVRGLLLSSKFRDDFYRCMTEKLMTYALGRGPEPTDIETIDQIAARLEREGGRASALLMGVIESAAFQKRRAAAPVAASE